MGKMPVIRQSVPERLKRLGDVYRERNAAYGDDYKLHGIIMTGLFPDGVQLKTVDDFNRFAIVKEMATKLARYAKNFHNGGHEDSLNDISVYGQMEQELDHDR